MAQTIRNPVEWVVDELREVAGGVGQASRSVQHTSTHLFSRPLAVSHITVADLKEVLAKGFDDFMAYRTDIIFLIAVYPIISLIVIAASFRYELIPLVFPLVSGSAILGPFVGVFLYEMSRRREINIQRHHVDSHSWANAVSVVRSRNFGKIMLLGMMLVALYTVWLVCAWGIYQATQGPTTAESVGRFINDLFLTPGRMVADHRRLRRRLPVCGRGPGHHGGRVSAAARSRCRPGHGCPDLDPGRARQSGSDRRVGADRGRRADPGRDPARHRPGDRDAGAVSRHLASLPQAGAAPERRITTH